MDGNLTNVLYEICVSELEQIPLPFLIVRNGTSMIGLSITKPVHYYEYYEMMLILSGLISYFIGLGLNNLQKNSLLFKIYKVEILISFSIILWLFSFLQIRLYAQYVSLLINGPNILNISTCDCEESLMRDDKVRDALNAFNNIKQLAETYSLISFSFYFIHLGPFLEGYSKPLGWPVFVGTACAIYGLLCDSLNHTYGEALFINGLIFFTLAFKLLIYITKGPSEQTEKGLNNNTLIGNGGTSPQLALVNNVVLKMHYLACRHFGMRIPKYYGSYHYLQYIICSIGCYAIGMLFFPNQKGIIKLISIVIFILIPKPIKRDDGIIPQICWFIDNPRFIFLQNSHIKNDPIKKPCFDLLMCTVCLTNKRDILIMPCNHTLMCDECTKTSISTHGLKDCPMCRKKIHNIQKVFL